MPAGESKSGVDIPPPSALQSPIMSQQAGKSVTPGSLALDAVLVIAFFVLIYSLVAPHVPSNDRFWIVTWGGLTAACMSAVFWLCIQMFRVVLKAQREAKR
jgi:hypothetical protein